MDELEIWRIEQFIARHRRADVGADEFDHTPEELEDELEPASVAAEWVAMHLGGAAARDR